MKRNGDSVRVLVAHVEYRQPGGEDAVARREAQCLEDAGADVSRLVIRPKEWDSLALGTRLRIGLHFSDHSYGRERIADAIAAHRADVVHFHNVCPTLGPGAVSQAVAMGVGCVQTLHNYRLSCIAGTHWYKGEACERCSPGRHRAGVARGCYRGSRVQSLAMARAMGRLWRFYLAERSTVLAPLTGYMRDKYADYGMPPDRLVVKPNRLPDTEAAWGPRPRGLDVVFIGRLSAEKGVRELVRAWPATGPCLLVAGDGPLRAEIEGLASGSIRVLGQVDADRIAALLRSAGALVVPSTWYEGLPLVVIEAFRAGTPVVSFDLGSIGAVVTQQGPGMTVAPGHVTELTALACSVASLDADAHSEAQVAARRAYEEHYAGDRCAGELEDLYRLAIERRLAV